MEGGTTLTWEEAEKKGIQIQLSFFSNGSNDWDDPDNGISVSDDATAVHRIRLQFSRTDGQEAAHFEMHHQRHSNGGKNV